MKEAQGGSSIKDAIIDLISGTAGGTASVYVGQPGDTVKVKMQTFPQIYNKGMVHCFKETWRKDGLVRGLYAGTGPALAANISENAVLFAAYGSCQKLVAFLNGESVGQMSPIWSAASGFLAGFFSSFTLCPTELVKCRLQALSETSMTSGVPTDGKKIGPWSICKSIMKEEGILGFYRGLTSTFAREMPGYFFFFGGYEVTRYLLTPKGKTKDEIGSVRTIICGGCGGMALWIAIFPTDVVKSRIQISTTKQTLIGCAKEIVRKEGVRALYNGLGPTLIRTFPATGALFLAYETTKKFLNKVFY